jgi:hypothetical protein
MKIKDKHNSFPISIAYINQYSFIISRTDDVFKSPMPNQVLTAFYQKTVPSLRT